MRHAAWMVAVLTLALPAPGAGQSSDQARFSVPAWSDEFVGPFPSWSDVRADYGAAGDGTTDDTAALQAALDDLGSPDHSPVLFLPAGTYRITGTLELAFRINVSLVGEDPDGTILLWDGPAGATMLSINGVAYSRFVRLTFDGQGTAAVAVEQSWDGSRPHFDTGNEYADDVFMDVEYGIRGGFRGHGFAETTVVRSRFVRNTGAGVALGNFNALDLWIWHSVFDHCNVGVTNRSGAGNFHVYNSIFRASQTADLAMADTGGFSARGNYSMGSRAFFVADSTNNPATIHLQGNTIVDPVDSAAIRLGNQGPGLITDNVIRSLPGAVGPVISWSNLFGADVVTVGNTFTVTGPTQANGRWISVDDRVVERSTLSLVEPVLPGPLPKFDRRVFHVSPGADADAIQDAIDDAAAWIGSRPVVHIPSGVYDVARTVVVPAGDLQITGDGYDTILRWNGRDSGPVMRLEGPTAVALRELQIDGAGRADGLVIDDVDQVGSRVYMLGVQLRSGAHADLSIDGLDHTHVLLEDIGFAYSPDGVAVRVTGGPLSAAGEATAGRTSILSGASSGNGVSFDVSGGARVLVRDLWYESGAGPGFARIHGRATFTADGLRVSSPVGQAVPAFDVADLDGTVAILATHFDDRIVVGGNGASTRVVAMASFCERAFPECFSSAAGAGDGAAVLASRQVSRLPFGTRSEEARDVGTADAAFIRSMLAHARSEIPGVVESLPAGVTDARLFRVWVTGGLTNVTLRSAVSEATESQPEAR